MSARSLADKLDCATAPAVIASDDAPTMSTSIAGRSNGLRNIAMTTLNPRTWETAPIRPLQPDPLRYPANRLEFTQRIRGWQR